MFTREEIAEALGKGLDALQRQKLSSARVAIAGAGGLGSNIAVWLARLGVGHLLLIDFDRVELSNLNRQYYFLEDVGEYKALALQKKLLRINPCGDFQAQLVKITEANLTQLFAAADIVCEALDDAAAKAMLVSGIMENFPEKKIVAASGLAGFGEAKLLQTRRVRKNFYLCGDGASDFHNLPLCGARVGICAAQQALVTARLLLGMEEEA